MSLRLHAPPLALSHANASLKANANTHAHAAPNPPYESCPPFRLSTSSLPSSTHFIPSFLP
eukprot:2173334-Pleurochrysis_carterae.AAC.1